MTIESAEENRQFFFGIGSATVFLVWAKKTRAAYQMVRINSWSL